MSGVENRLTGNAAFLDIINVSNTWNTANLDASVHGTSELAPNSNYKQIQLKVSNGNISGSLTISDVQLFPEDSDVPTIFVFAVRMPSGGTITTSLVHSDGVSSNSVSTTVNLLESAAAINAPGILSPQWFIFRSNPLIPTEPDGNTPFLNLQIDFEPSDVSETFYFTMPALYPQYGFIAANNAVIPIATHIPEVIIDTDANALVSPDIPLLRFIDVATLGLGDALNMVSSFSYIDIEEGFDDSIDRTKSTFVNNDVASFAYLVWLCKFISTSPVLRFESSLDYSANAFTLVGIDGLGGSTLDSGDILRLTSVDPLNPPVLTELQQEILLRWQLDYGFYGRNAGTVPAITEAAKLMLIENKFVNIEYDYNVEPFVIDIQTYWYETYGAQGVSDIGLPSELVLEAVEYARPLGVLVRHEMIG